MAENKTQFTKADVRAFLNRIPEEGRRKDAFALVQIMQQITGRPPRMYGPTIVGFGSYHYRYATGREGEAPLAAFSPRKPEFVVYLMGVLDQEPQLLRKLGKHRASKVCLYIACLDVVHVPTLKQLIRKSIAYVKKKYG